MQDMTLKDIGKLMRQARDRVNRARKSQGDNEITQGMIAKSVGVSVTAISDWEQGKSQPGVLNFVKYCNVLGISIGEVFGEKKTPNSKLKLTAIPVL